MTAALPRVAPEVTATVLEAMPRRLRDRLPEAVGQADSWAIVATGQQTQVGVGAATVTLAQDEQGVVSRLEDASCDCLLTPRCLHLAAVLSSAPLSASPPATSGADSHGGGGRATAHLLDPSAPHMGSPAPGRELSPRERHAAESAWRALAEVLEAGAERVGSVEMARLLRAIHTSRAANLPLLAAATSQVAEANRRLSVGHPGFDREELVAALRNALVAANRLLTGSNIGPRDRGTARRGYAKAGSKTLQGVLSEPILTSTGYLGVVTVLTDEVGDFWSRGDVTPGTRVDHVRSAYHGAAGLGGLTTSHRSLSRAGVIAGGLTASHDGRLGGGAFVQAVPSKHRSWFATPLAAMWQTSLERQVHAALQASGAGDAGTGGGLIFVDVEVIDADQGTLAVRSAGGVSFGVAVSESATHLGAIDDLRLLASAEGLLMRIIGRLDPRMPKGLTLLAFGPRGSDSEVTERPRLEFPPEWHGRAFPGLDRLTAGMVTISSSAMSARSRQAPSAASDDSVPSEQPLERATRWIGRVAVHGRLPLLTAQSRIAQDVSAMTRSAAVHGASLLRDLSSTAAEGDRRFDGTLNRPVDRLAQAWLRLAVYTAEASNHLAAQRWVH